MAERYGAAMHVDFRRIQVQLLYGSQWDDGKGLVKFKHRNIRDLQLGFFEYLKLRLEKTLLIESTFGITNAGAKEKSSGCVAASPYETIRASGLTPNSFAFSAVEIRAAAAPSFKVEAFAAVIVPLSKN